MSGAYGCRRLEGRVALVVAATRGIGLACARALAAEADICTFSGGGGTDSRHEVAPPGAAGEGK